MPTSSMPPPGLDLASPGTYLYDGAASSRGYRLNRFALSLRNPDARKAFLAEEDAYLERFALAPAERALVRTRDWTGLLQAGGHLQAILKLAATVGQDLYDIGGHNAGVDRATLYASCPRRIAELGDLDG